jgi:hypothetical protein
MRRTPCLLLLLLPMSLTVVLGCGAGGGGGSRDGATSRGGAAPAGGGDIASVEADVEELLSEHDRLVSEILREPSVARDPDDLLVQQYVDLYEPDSARPAATIERWVALADEGRSMRPYDDTQPLVRTRIDGEIEVVADDEVTVPVCEEHRERVYQHGRLVSGTPLAEQAGEVVVARIDGEWLLREHLARPSRPSCGQDPPSSPPEGG